MIDEARTKHKKTNYYLTLDINPGASHNEILHAYNRAKNTYSGGSLASYSLMESEDNSSIMEEIEEAFKTLGNPAKRREYDVEMGFNSWTEDPAQKPQDINPADLLGVQKKQKSQAANQAPTATLPANPISSLAASISSIGDMSFEGEVLPSATVIPMKPVSNTTTAASSSAGPSTLAQTATLAKTADKIAPAVTSGPSKSAAKNAAVGGVEFEPNPEFEKQIQNVTEVDGPFLKAVRIYRRYTPEALALRCKLSTSHILTLENEDTTAMHQPVYLRGHVLLVCQALDLPNPHQLAKSYVERIASRGKLQKKPY